jgi:hypothetical protein
MRPRNPDVLGKSALPFATTPPRGVSRAGHPASTPAWPPVPSHPTPCSPGKTLQWLGLAIETEPWGRPGRGVATCVSSQRRTCTRATSSVIRSGSATNRVARSSPGWMVGWLVGWLGSEVRFKRGACVKMTR